MLIFISKVIKQIRTYILRCYACYKTTSIMTKIFCPKCGNKTLKRVSVSLDENGQQVVSLILLYKILVFIYYVFLNVFITKFYTMFNIIFVFLTNTIVCVLDIV